MVEQWSPKPRVLSSSLSAPETKNHPKRVVFCFYGAHLTRLESPSVSRRDGENSPAGNCFRGRVLSAPETACYLVFRTYVCYNEYMKGGDTVQYYELSNKKFHFIVTPDELRVILKDFHHVIVTTGVRKNYIESNPNDFFFTYDAIYKKLKNGDKLVLKTDDDIAQFSTGITAHLENCMYQPSARLSVPNFAEPCPTIDTFCFLPWKDQLSTSFSVTQFPENICGLCLSFPAKIEYENDTEKHSAGIVDCTNLDDFKTYETLVERIKSITKPLKLDMNGKLRRTSARISDKAKKDFCNFYFISSNNITII